MNDHLKETLTKIGEDFQTDIAEGSRFYLEVDIGEEAAGLGFSDIQEKFGKTYAIIPIKRPRPGMKVRIDGRTFVNYAQFDSGIVAPGYVAKEANLPYRTFIPNDSMIRNF
jgi:hypothetical protein